MQQMRLLRWHTNFMVLTRAEDSLAILTHHRATNHSHGSAYLTDLTVNSYFSSLYPTLLANFKVEAWVRGEAKRGGTDGNCL
jgi:hypothetical protein